jgi:hypothetical protein
MFSLAFGFGLLPVLSPEMCVCCSGPPVWWLVLETGLVMGVNNRVIA